MNLHLITTLFRQQDRMIRLLGGQNSTRHAVLANMLARDPRETVGYWLQLVVSVGIATLGLTLGSAAVVISAMLVAPLMSPIVALAMGLASGSPFLVVRSALRVALSIATAVAGAALITTLLPFHEINSEIAARTSPTVLDLLTAAFCALTGVYASVRPGSDTASTAAGASIGISLVPPLCASGYGIGIADWAVAGGAAMLFLANLVAILVVGTLAFVLLGFSRLDVAALERDELARHGDSTRATGIYAALGRLFESRGGPVLRLSMPLVLLALVYVPLRQALDEVAWQVSTRNTVEGLLRRTPGRIVQSRLTIERGRVELALMLLGSQEEAESVRRELMALVRSAIRGESSVEVLAVPDADAFAGLESRLRSAAPRAAPLLVPPPVDPLERLDTVKAGLHDTVARLWPGTSAGNLLRVDIDVSPGQELRLQLTHHGAQTGEAGREAIEHALRDALKRPVRLSLVTIPSERLLARELGTGFLPRVSRALAVAQELPQVVACVTVPPAPPSSQRRVPAEVREAQQMLAALEPYLREQRRAERIPGEELALELRLDACGEPATPSDAALTTSPPPAPEPLPAPAPGDPKGADAP